MKPDQVVVHPLVLLSVVDNYNRVAKDTSKRVVGVLLGEASKGRIDVTNSYAVPFEEEDQSPNIWFFDHSYHEEMFRLFKKINAREKVVGWYSTGPSVKDCDLDIHEIMLQYCKDPVLVVIDVKHSGDGLPIRSYYSIEEIQELGTQKSKKVYVPIAGEVGAYEAEEIGVEHLLRDVKDSTISTLSSEVTLKVSALRGLATRLEDVKIYLESVGSGKLTMNHDILSLLQDVLNLLPNIQIESMAQSLTTKTNDMMLSMYVSSLVRGVVALHNLINNKILNREREKVVESLRLGTKNKEDKDAKGEKDEQEGKENEVSNT